jgi:hypothetical protein
VLLCPQRLKCIGCQPDFRQRGVSFLAEPRQPSDRRPVELRTSGPDVASDERKRVDQAELTHHLSGHFRRNDVPATNRALEASRALAGHDNCRWGLELFITREAAEAELEEILLDEPDWRGVLRVVTIELDGPRVSAN